MKISPMLTSILALAFCIWVWAIVTYSRSEKCMVVDAIVVTDRRPPASAYMRAGGPMISSQSISHAGINPHVATHSASIEKRTNVNEEDAIVDQNDDNNERTAAVKEEPKMRVPLPSTDDSAQLYGKLFEMACPRSRSKIAVVMPYIKPHVEYVIQNLKTWTTYRPCSEAFAFANGDSGFRPHVTMLFYFNNKRDIEVESEIRAAWEQLNRPASVKEEENGPNGFYPVSSCFADIGFLWADMNETELNHHINTAVQFEKLFDLLAPMKIDYFFQMEPDTWPVRSHWLDKIYFESVCGSDFWVKGSSFRNAPRRYLHYHGDHINGNALYNARDRDFIEVMRKQVKQGLARARPYDLALWDTFARPTEFRRDTLHLYLHADWVFNYGGKSDTSNEFTPWTAQLMNERSPNTFLVHGKAE